VQATDGPHDDLVAAVYGVIRRLKALRSTLPVDSGALPLLGLLMEHDAQRLSDLAGSACLDVSTASRHVRALEDAGLVARTTDPDDRRASRLSLTDAGRTELRRAHDVRKAMLDEATSGWTRTDRRTLTSLLQRLADDLSTTQDSHEKTTTEATTTR
jgi:DNA-binding MarR family transcriptional regulator